MVKVTFKNVDQGDSIIIEWKIKGKEHVGIIDCNVRDDGHNPVTEHIQVKGYKSINFVVLSHPHTDHFSGMNDLFLFCEKKGITIQKFIHTAHSKKEYLLAAVSKGPHLNKLAELFKTIHRLTVKKDTITESCFLGGDIRIIDFSGLTLSFLAPTFAEYSLFDAAIAKPREDSRINNPDANLIATVIKVHLEDNYLLLTSDAAQNSFRRICKKDSTHLKSKLLLGQIPHHGANNNHFKKFWEKQAKYKNIPAVVSVGENGYGHPSEPVINSYKKMEFIIYSTNQVGALLEFDSKSLENSAALLDWASESSGPLKFTTPNFDLNGDQSFIYEKSRMVHV